MENVLPQLEDVNGTAKFCIPWAVNLEQFAINSARQQFVSEYTKFDFGCGWLRPAPIP